MPKVINGNMQAYQFSVKQKQSIQNVQIFNFELAAKTLEIRTEARKKTSPTELVSVVIGLLHYMLTKRSPSSAKARIHRGKLGGAWSFFRAVTISGKSKVNPL
jgi:hypothetical protein